jgi:diguanylate cyclase (GGDEF)-like protein
MKQYIRSVTNNSELLSAFDFFSSLQERRSARSILIQFFSSTCNSSWIAKLQQTAVRMIPEAKIAGCSTTGEIANGKVLENTTVITVFFFMESLVSVIPFDAEKETDSSDTDRRLVQEEKENSSLAGIQIIATMRNYQIEKDLAVLDSVQSVVPVFGGGAGSYTLKGDQVIFDDTVQIHKGFLSVLYSGKNLHIDVESYFGWQQLGRSMKVTKVTGDYIIDELDNQPAFSIYNKYLGIKNDETFFQNALEFPIVITRNGTSLARVPESCTKEGSIELTLSVQENDSVRLAFGYPQSIIEHGISIRRIIKRFDPQALVLFSCCCRKMFLLDNVSLETEPFQKISPSSGYFTYGEIAREGEQTSAYHMTLVAAAFREGESTSVHISDDKEINIGEVGTGVIPIVNMLAQFVDVTTKELEESNRKLVHLAITDELTQLYNRGEIEYLLGSSLEKIGDGNGRMSLIMLDIDDFKKVNDTYGHEAGDRVLKIISGILRNNIRKLDPVGRWGGEEFMAVLPQAPIEIAQRQAEKIRAAIEAADFGIGKKVTVSIGVTETSSSEDKLILYRRVDEALYKAKADGKNRVVVIEPAK